MTLNSTTSSTICALLIVLFVGFARSSVAVGDSVKDDSKFFEEKVRPLLAEKCWSCHGEKSAQKGGLRLTSRSAILEGGDSGPAVVTGKPEESALIRAVSYRDEPKMPPKERLKDSEIEILKRWVAGGLAWPNSVENMTSRDERKSLNDWDRDHWAFQPIKPGQPPEVRESSWIKSPIDRFILHGLESKNLPHSLPANKPAWIRRATFDLIGLPPTPAEVEAFLADHSAEAYARVVDRLLASPAYGQRWGRHWLDVVRYADARDLIQLPPESDFREAWRYRDWVVDAFNNDLPFNEFVRDQVAGDLVPSKEPGGFNAKGLVATGMLAIADFVPGDVDKDQMIADYVNDEIDVVGRGFLGLSLACARCHDHKFDPISTEDYYALAGIFFSTRLIPSPVLGNTPIVRAPLLPAADVEKIKQQNEERSQRIATLEHDIHNSSDREFVAHARATLFQQTSRYLIAAANLHPSAKPSKESVSLAAKENALDETLLTSWVDYLARVSASSNRSPHSGLLDAASGKITGPALETVSRHLQARIDVLAENKSSDVTDAIIQFRADNPQTVTGEKGSVTLWPNHAVMGPDAVPVAKENAPTQAEVEIKGHKKTVLRFDGKSLFEVAAQPPTTGSLFAVFRSTDNTAGGQRLVGWEDSDSGKHGLGIMPTPDGGLHVILRNDGKAGDLVDTKPCRDFQIVSVTWGPGGTLLSRNGATQNQNAIDSISPLPSSAGLRIGGPGTGSGARFRGELAELRIYDRPLIESERRTVEKELEERWFGETSGTTPITSEATILDELLSRRGPFWVSKEQRAELLPAETKAKLLSRKSELEQLQKTPPREIPHAVVVQDGGPTGTRFEGFKDSPIFIRGDYKKTGKIVPRGFPKILDRENRQPIKEGSGRRQLAEWLTRPDNPLTPRVMVNRIWRHHFGEGLVRTPNDFGRRGDRPTHPELLDDLAARFMESGWSIKGMHRLVMLSSTYQQRAEGSPELLSSDPDNRLLGRINRRRLDAEAIRDSLLAVAGRLDRSPAETAFVDIKVPKRTLYLSSTRTGAGTSDFGRLFDHADPGSIVAQRDESIVAPQSLFFLNDPFVREQAEALATRVAREESGDDRSRIRRVSAIVFGRDPSIDEINIGLHFLALTNNNEAWIRYSLIQLASNEFIYVE